MLVKMKKIGIISVGNELLCGSTVDTNTAWIADKAKALGLEISLLTTAGDDFTQISDAIAYSAKYCQTIIITGGLGPTKDDLTRFAISNWANSPLELDQELLESIKDFFISRGREMPLSNDVQAMIPKSATVIPNNWGTAPGIFIRHGDVDLYSLPGVPYEMKNMFDSFVAKSIATSSLAVKRGILKVYGLGESTLAEMLGDMMDRGRNPEVNCTAENFVITLYVVARSLSNDNCDLDKMIFDEKAKIKEILGDYVFTQEDNTLEEVVGKMLTSRSQTVATAESCTGGLISQMLTSCPGASEYFSNAWITYSNSAKITELNVSMQTLDKYGAVSGEVVSEMASGALKKSNSDYAIAVSGIAGPAGGTEQKPVGTVYICVMSKDKTQVQKCFFPYSRDLCRSRTALEALNILRVKFL